MSSVTNLTIGDPQNWSDKSGWNWEIKDVRWLLEDLLFHALLNLSDDSKAGLDECGSLGVSSEHVNELHIVCNFVKLMSSFVFSLLGLLFLCLFKLVEVTFIILYFQILEFKNFIDDGVQEVLSVRNDNDGDIESENVLFEPD